MKTTQNLTCYLIGQDNLLLECAKILRSRSWVIKGIISPSNNVKEWTQRQQIAYVHSLSEVDWKGGPADYLFSIVNNEIIPSTVLEQIRLLSINYHDAPLPRYAGSNATSWALLNNETMHGITWHAINELIDGGDILKQVAIPISSDETALSLNMKCFEQAIASFSDLANELLTNTYQRIPQDLSQRTYFARAQKPANNGWINWHSSAGEIDRLWRATQFGDYRHTFTVAKIVLGDDVFVINKLTVLSEQSSLLPGTVVELNSDSWKVATKTHNILISDLSTAQGSSAELATLIKQYKISVGTELTSPKPDRRFVEEASWTEDVNQVEATAINLSSEERQQLLVDWNSTDTPYPAQKTIQGMFEEQVSKTPHHLALIASDVQLTYEELNNRANQLAHYLITTHAVQPDQLIAVCLERSEWMLIALMGILKSGGAYVPLEPDYPARRVSYILNDANVRVMLTTQAHAEQLRQLPDVDWQKTTLLVLDHPDFLLRLSQQSTLNPVTVTTSRHLAYVMYTSGTTGTPKGVMIEHRGIVNQIFWMNQTYPLRSTDRILQKTTYVFDISVWELFWANWYGATVVFAKPEGHSEPLYLSELIKQAQISIIQFTPSMLNVFVQAIANEEIDLSSLRHLFCIGEVLHRATVNKVQALIPKVKIHNIYGPTEASINVLFFGCINQQAVYLGKPIANTRAYILNEQCRLLPVGVSGELHIAGAGLARGYLNQTKLTAQQFIANPFQTEQDKKTGQYDRLYKTGDLARWLPDGNLDFLGRNDTQVKLRGYRIELSEIEHVMQRYPEIRQSVVIVTNDSLIAYYIAQQPIDVEKIQSYIGQYVPEYMVPAQFIFLKNFPLNISGKVDKKKLPLPFASYSRQIAHPTNKTEEKITAVFAAVLGLEQTKVSVIDDFFKLGGDSILAIRLVSRLNLLFQKTFQVKDVLKLKTIQAISTVVENPWRVTKKPETTYEPFSLIDKEQYQDKLGSNQIEDIYPASYSQIGMLLESSFNDKGTYHDVFYYEINLPFDQEKFLTIWEALAKKHALLRAHFLFSDEHALDVVIFKKSHLPVQFYNDQPLQQLIDVERKNHFSHTEEYLFHLLINQHTDKFEFIFSFHHAIVDGWSVASLINEFVQAYANKQSVDHSVLLSSEVQQSAAPLLSYGEYVQNERRSLHDQASIAFWKDYLANYEPAEAKWKFDDETTSPDSLFSSSFSLSTEEADLVQQLAREHAVSVDSVFLFAYLKTLSSFLNSADITVGVVFNNRLEKSGGDTLFGLFLNVLPFRFQPKQNASLQEELIETFNTKIKLYEHKHIPYAHLRSIFNRDLYKFGFSFIHFHVLKSSEKFITKRGGFDRTSIPFLLEVAQGDTFKLELKAHDDYINQEYLDYFGRYLKTTLLNVMNNKNQIIFDTNDYPNTGFRIDLSDIEKMLNSHPSVKQSVVLALDLKKNCLPNLNNDKFLVGYYVPTLDLTKEDEKNYIEHWENLYEFEYSEIHDQDYQENLTGWKSSFTEEAISQEEMHGWKNETLKRILDLKPKRILEIGSGTGLLLFNLIEKCQHYYATDISEQSIQYLHQHSDRLGYRDKVTFIKGASNTLPFSSLQEKYDFAILNSVIQYFPHLDYLKGTLNNLIENMAQAGKIFIGDVRDYRLLHCFHYTVLQFKKIQPSPQEIDSFIKREKELLVSPDFFLYLKKINPRISQVELLPKLGMIPIEMVNYRYDVVLHIGAGFSQFQRIDSNQFRQITDLDGYVSTNLSEMITFQYPNKRILKEYSECEKMYGNTITLNNQEIENLLTINQIGQLLKKHGYETKLYLSPESPIVLNVVGYKQEAFKEKEVVIMYENELSTSSNYANNPLLNIKLAQNHHNDEIKSYLQAKLPDYMVPAYLMPLIKLPLTPGGKLDYAALPVPELSISENYVAPRNDQEHEFCRIFSDILGLSVEVIGIKSSFFKLGGNSLLAIILVSRLNKIFAINLKICDVFKHKNIENLSKLISLSMRNMH